MVAKNKSAKLKMAANRQKKTTEIVKVEKFFVREIHKHHILALIVSLLLGITAILLLITYFSNNA